MKRLMLLMLLLAAPAQAVNWTVTSDAELTAANLGAVAGDSILIPADTLTVAINPRNSGTGDSLEKRISYIGSLTAPSARTVSSINLSSSYISVKGVSTTSASGVVPLTTSTFYVPEVRDSIAYCVLNGGLSLTGAVQCVVSNNTIVGPVQFSATGISGDRLNQLAAGCTVATVCRLDTLKKNTITVSPIVNHAFVTRAGTQNCLVDSNRITMSFQVAGPWGGDAAGRYLTDSNFNTFSDNSWTITADGNVPGGKEEWIAFNLRDSTHDITFLRDTMKLGLGDTHLIGGRLHASGTYPFLNGSINYNNRWSQCYYLATANMFLGGGWYSSAIDSSVFASRYKIPINLYGYTLRGCRISHNSLYSYLQSCLSNPWMWLATDTTLSSCGLDVHNNIFGNVRMDTTGNNSGAFHALRGDDPAKALTSDYNLYWANGLNSGTLQNHAIGCGSDSYPLDGTMCTSTSMHGPLDCNSKWGNPAWLDTTFASFDPRILTNSAAASDGNGGYIGARAPLCSDPDSVVGPVLALPQGGMSGGATLYYATFQLPAVSDTCMADSFLAVWDTTGSAPCLSGCPGTENYLLLAIARGCFKWANPDGWSPGDYITIPNIPLYYGSEPANWSVSIFSYTSHPVTGTGWSNFTSYRHQSP